MDPIQNLWGRLITQTPYNQDIHFSISNPQPNHYIFQNKWKVYQTPDNSITKIINYSYSYLRINDRVLKKNQKRILRSGDRITFNEPENGIFFDHVFILMKDEPKNELKREREREPSLQDSIILKKSVKVEEEQASEEWNVDRFFRVIFNKESRTKRSEKLESLLPRKTPPERKLREKNLNISQDLQLPSNLRIIFLNGDLYEGETKDSLMHGQGVLKFDNGDEYKGDFVAGKRHGDGEMKYSNGDIYKGNWKNNNKEGKGVLTLKNGAKYEGTWIGDTIQQQVNISYQGGALYEGTINQKTLNREGNGLLVRNNGDIYEGDFVNQFPEGRGMYVWKCGDIYEGEMKGGKREGLGTMEFANGDRFEGSWKKDKREGKGILRLCSGLEYEAVWKNDEIIGKGKYRTKDGFVFKGKSYR